MQLIARTASSATSCAPTAAAPQTSLDRVSSRSASTSASTSSPAVAPSRSDGLRIAGQPAASALASFVTGDERARCPKAPAGTAPAPRQAVDRDPPLAARQRQRRQLPAGRPGDPVDHAGEPASDPAGGRDRDPDLSSRGPWPGPRPADRGRRRAGPARAAAPPAATARSSCRRRGPQPWAAPRPARHRHALRRAGSQAGP